MLQCENVAKIELQQQQCCLVNFLTFKKKKNSASFCTALFSGPSRRAVGSAADAEDSPPPRETRLAVNHLILIVHISAGIISARHKLLYFSGVGIPDCVRWSVILKQLGAFTVYFLPWRAAALLLVAARPSLAFTQKKFTPRADIFVALFFFFFWFVEKFRSDVGVQVMTEKVRKSN